MQALDEAGFEDLNAIVTMLDIRGHKNETVLDLIAAARGGIYEALNEKKPCPTENNTPSG